MTHNVTNSERACSACAQRWLIKYGLGCDLWEPSLAISIGIVWHDLLEFVGVQTQNHGIEAGDAAAAFFNAQRGKLEEDGALDAEYENIALCETMWEGYTRTHGADPFEGMTMVHVEQAVEVVARVDVGGRIIAATVSGKIDKLVHMKGDPEGTAWIVEHKSTSLDPHTWIDKHEYSPQGLFYAWMTQRALGLKVAGIVYDVACRKRPRDPEELLTQAGKLRSYSASRLPTTTALRYAKAARMAEAKGHAKPDHFEAVHRALEAREADGYWFKRFKVRFNQKDIARAGQEMAVMGNRILGWWAHTQGHRARVKAASGKGPQVFGQAASAALEEIGHLYPRNHAECNSVYGKCKYMELCRTWSPEAASSFSLRGIRPHEGPG